METTLIKRSHKLLNSLLGCRQTARLSRPQALRKPQTLVQLLSLPQARSEHFDVNESSLAAHRQHVSLMHLLCPVLELALDASLFWQAQVAQRVVPFTTSVEAGSTSGAVEAHASTLCSHAKVNAWVSTGPAAVAAAAERDIKDTGAVAPAKRNVHGKLTGALSTPSGSTGPDAKQGSTAKVREVAKRTACHLHAGRTFFCGRYVVA